jgi:hypothetical protein
MIIHDLDVPGVAIAPKEADAPLVVDPDAVLAAPIALERLQPIRRRSGQKRQARRRIDQPKLAISTALDVARQVFDVTAGKQRFRVPTLRATGSRSYRNGNRYAGPAPAMGGVLV